MQNDERCCGAGTCIINAQGHCWCGQQWDGEKMCRPPLNLAADAGPASSTTSNDIRSPILPSADHSEYP